VKLVLSSLWIAMLIVFAYVDIFALLRADVLRAAPPTTSTTGRGATPHDVHHAAQS
jgi:hypothetical protein